MFKLTHFRFIAAIHTVVGLKVHYTIVSLVKKSSGIERGEKKRKWRRENFNRKSHEIYVDTPAIWRTYLVHFLHFLLTTSRLISGEVYWFSDKNSCRSFCKILMTLKSILLVSDPRILNSDRILIRILEKLDGIL